MPVLEADKNDLLEAYKARFPDAEYGLEDVQIVTIRIKKGMSKDTEACLAEVGLDMLPREELAIVLQLGLEARINGTGFSKVEKGDTEEALKVARDNIQKLYEGKLRAPVGLAGARKKKKAAGKAMDKLVEAKARKLARDETRALIRASGDKVSHYKAAKINAFADELLENEEFGPAIWAKAEILAEEERKAKEEAAEKVGKKGEAGAIAMLKGKLSKDPELVAKSEAKAKVSKKGAGLAAARAAKKAAMEARANV